MVINVGTRLTVRHDRQTVMLGLPLGSGAAHVVQLGPVGIEHAFKRIGEVGVADEEPRGAKATAKEGLAQRSHDTSPVGASRATIPVIGSPLTVAGPRESDWV